MWNGLPLLILLCIVMAASSFLVGLLPLSLSLSSRQLRLITALGTGVLVGTALIVIIPEGVETLYSAGGSTHSHGRRSVSLTPTRATLPDVFPGSLKHDTWRRGMIAVPLDTDISADTCIYLKKRQESRPDDDPTVPPTPPSDHSHDDEDDHDAATPAPYDPHTWVGISLITGFILMYLIDTLPRQALTPTIRQTSHISLNQFSLTRTRTSSLPSTTTTSHSHSQGSSRSSSTTLGLVIHALADGIALGASSSSTATKRLSFIIFLALMLHKAPAAFGLTSVLLKQGLSTRAARAHLIVFSLAAPVGALVTWAAAHILGFGGNGIGTEFATAVLLLFSGGTFLYVAVHTMLEGQDDDHHSDGQSNGGYVGVPMTEEGIYGAPGPPAAGKRGGSGGVTDTMVTVVGMLVPLVVARLGHAH